MAVNEWNIIHIIKFITTSIANIDTHNPMKVATYEADMKAVITTLCTTTFQLKSKADNYKCRYRWCGKYRGL